MNTPMSDKTEGIKDFLEALNPGTRDAIARNLCPRCHVQIDGFKNDISRREYLVSGWCQSCQDTIFG